MLCQDMILEITHHMHGINTEIKVSWYAHAFTLLVSVCSHIKISLGLRI